MCVCVCANYAVAKAQSVGQPDGRNGCERGKKRMCCVCVCFIRKLPANSLLTEEKKNTLYHTFLRPPGPALIDKDKTTNTTIKLKQKHTQMFGSSLFEEGAGLQKTRERFV